MPKNDWTVPSTLGKATFTPPAPDDLAECPKRIYGHGYSRGVHTCGRKVVTVINGAYRGDNGSRCAVHAAGVKRSMQNSLDRQEANRVREEAYQNRVAEATQAKNRIRAHGIVIPDGWGTPTWPTVADWLDQVRQAHPHVTPEGDER